MSHLLLFWLLLVLGNLLKNPSCFVGCLTLLKESDELERAHRHSFICICKLKLMCLGLHKEDLFALLLCHGQLHCLTEVATVKIAEELYLMLHEHVHWHESGLFGGWKPLDQLVANIGESDNGLKVIPDAFIKVCLRMVCVGGAPIGNFACPFGQKYVPKKH
jgi:hypothetical protein